MLATAAGPKFSTSVKVPNAPPGVYYIKATARNADGTVAGSASRAFQLTAAAPRRSPSQAPTKRVARREVGNRESGRSRGTAPRANAAPAVTTRSGARAVAGTSRVERPAPATPARATSKARGDSGKQAGSPRSDRGPSARSANGDLWSGFNAGIPRDAGLLGRSAPTAAPGSQLIPGLALLGLGVMALAGGLGVAVMRRRAAASRTP